MALLGWPLVILLAILAVALPVTTVLFWARLPGPRGVRTAMRLALVGASQVAAVLLVAAMLNDYGYFYASWSELLGRSSPVGQPSAAAPGHPLHGRRPRKCRGRRYGDWYRSSRSQPWSGSCRTRDGPPGLSGPAGAGSSP